MGGLRIHLANGVEMTFIQLATLDRLMDEHGEENCHWHPQACGCCFALHVGEDEAYVVGEDGGYTHFLRTPDGVLSPVEKPIPPV